MSTTSVKNLTKSIIKEAKAEESNIKHAKKDLEHTEKSLFKAQKVSAGIFELVSAILRQVHQTSYTNQAAAKAEATLKTNEQKALEAQQSLNKAEHKHEIAVANVHTAEKDVEVRLLSNLCTLGGC
jgi:hydrogenase maturation factor HypF (carbamoyltransferase family)